MHKTRALKGLLAVSAAAAMFSTFGAHAQSTTGTTAVQSANPTGAQAGSESTGQSGTSGTTASSSAKLSSGDQKALKDMAQANINEVAAGKIAQGKAQSSEVKAYAQRMIDDHGQALTKVQGVAQQKGVTLPTEPDLAHKAMAAKLEKLNGEAFDKAYMQNGGVKDHTAVHKKLMSNAKKIKDADVKALAAEHMPVVEQHLKSAKEMVSASVSSGK